MSADDNARNPRRRDSKDRQEAWRGGRWAESLATLRLRCSGYRILARNWRSPVGEIDIIARRGQLLVIVEVKRRPERALALAAISPRQQERLARAALAFQARRTDCAGLGLRFDIITLGPGLWPHHLKDAWRPAAG
jgi:putative endonuclease